MESLHNDGLAERANGKGNSSGGGRRLGPSGIFLRLLACGLLCGVMIWFGAVQAQTSYVHDANGRVVAVTQSSGATVQYTYDALGHVGPISAPLLSGQLAIFAFMPTHGVAGTEVTLEGQGFSSTAANDSVSFNGTAGTVLSASPTQLVVTVPNGATTGPISVTVTGQTAISTTAFVVDDTGAPPAISQVSPLVIAAGGTVTVAGTHLDPVAGDTTIQMGGVNMLTGLSEADTQVQYTVPSNAASGHVTVNTPYGNATSAVSVAVLPSSIVSEVNGAPTSYLPTNGNAASFSTGAAGKNGVLTFDAPQGGNYEFTLNGVTITGSSATQINVNVYGPTGTVVASVACYTSSPGSSCRIALWNLVPGTYTAVVSPVDASSIISFNAIVEPDVIGPALAGNTPATINLAAGEVERLTFSANAGGTVALQLSGVSTMPTGQAMYVWVYGPGVVPTATNYYTTFGTTSSTTVNLPNLPATGIYTAVVFIVSGMPGRAQLTMVPGVTGSMTNGGAAQSYSTSASGQNAYLTFTATAGANLELALDNVSVSAGSGVSVNVYNAAGTDVGGFNCLTSSQGDTGRLALWNLAGGTYTVIVAPLNGGTMSFNALLQADVIGPALTANTPTTVDLGVGQIERLTFAANAGGTVALQLSGVSTTPSGQGVEVYIYSPATSTITTTNYYTSFTSNGSNTINLANLPASGTYTVVLFTTGIPASGQLTLATGITSTLSSGTPAQSFNTGMAGQNAYLTFTATAGANLELTLDNLSVSAGSGVSVNVYNAAGTDVGGFNCLTSSQGDTGRLALWNLAAGTYTVIVAPLSNGTMSFNTLLQADVIGPTLTANTPATINLGVGQIERVTFAANAGGAVALQLSDVSTTPSGQGVEVYIYSPATTTITTTNYYTSFISNGSNTINLANLPASGTYTVVLFTTGVPASGQLTLATGITSTLSSGTTAQSLNTGVSGQNAYLTFTATAGANLELTLDNLSVSAGSGVSVNVYNAAGTDVGGFNCLTSSQGDTGRLALWNLAAGTYTVIVAPLSNGTMSFNTLLQADVIGPALTLNTPAAINLGVGQIERVTFTANAGDTATLQLSGVSTTPSGQGIGVFVFSPASQTITTSDYYSSFISDGSNMLNLANLPASGTYTVVLYTTGIPASGQMTLTSQ